MLEKSLVTYTANFGKQHPNVALCQSSLANVYGDMGENEKARDLLEKALTSNIENFGKQHPNVAAVQSNLALIYYDLAEYKKARDLLENALASDIANFGKHNPNVAMSQTNLAAVYQNLGELKKQRICWKKLWRLINQIWRGSSLCCKQTEQSCNSLLFFRRNRKSKGII